MSTILTLELDPASHACFNRLRQLHYPAALNQIDAHLTLFHTLPAAAGIMATIERAAHHPPFELRCTGLRSLGRGVAFTLQSPPLLALHRQLAASFEPHLTAQDRQPLQPHVVVQNKTDSATAKALLAELQAGFTPFTVHATGLHLWDYLNGPWRSAALFAFR
jgi:hypothetical protein